MVIKKDLFFIALITIALFSLNFVFSSHTNIPTSFTVNEDVTNKYSISINNTNAVGLIGNITQISITLPSGFVVTSNTNGTSIGGNGTYTNTTLVLSWTNSTFYLINGSVNESFWFNASVATPGQYNITVTSTNYTALYNTTISVVINDTTPPNVSLAAPTHGANYSTSSMNFSVTVGDNVNTTSCWYTLNAGTTNYTMNSVSSIAFNATNTSIADGNYFTRFYCNDANNNINTTILANFTVDTPPVVTLISPTNGNTTVPTSIAFQFNVSDSTATTCNMTVNSVVWNGNSSVNVAGSTMTLTNFSYIPLYNLWNVTCIDFHNNTVTSSTRNFYIGSVELNGTVKNENANLLSSSVINVSIKNQVGWTSVGSYSTTSSATGWFNLSVAANSSWVYTPSITHRNITNPLHNFTDFISKSLPAFPSAMVSRLADTTFYLTPAGTINITLINATQGMSAFQYQIKDTSLGYPIAEEHTYWVNQTTVYVPKNRNYSIMIYPYQSMPVSFNWNNFTANSSYMIDSDISASDYNVTTYQLNKKFNITTKWVRVSGYIINTNGTIMNATSGGNYNWTNLTIVPYLLEPGNMIHSEYGDMPYNLSGSNTNTRGDVFNIATGFYNFSLPGAAETSNVIIFAAAQNGTNYYGGFRNISLAYSSANELLSFDTTIHGLLGTAADIVMDRVDGIAANFSVRTAKQAFYLINSTNSTMGSISAHAEITVNYSSYGALQFTWMADIPQSQSTANFAIPLLNVTGVKEMNIFSSGGPTGGNSQYAPRRVSTMTAAEITANNNITIKTFNPGAIDNSFTAAQIAIDLYISNSTCDVPNPPGSCALTSSATMASFNPMHAVMGGGKISFRMGTSGILIHYVNVDMLASGPPDALFENDAGTSDSSSTFSSAVKFGSQGPTIYDYVLISLPYLEGSTTQTGLNENADVNISIPVFYDDNWNVIWDTASNGTSASALAGNYSHYSAHQSAWANLTISKNCTKTVTSISETTPCYLDIDHNRIWIRIPHFSGAGPAVLGSLVTASAAATTPDSSGSSGISYDLPVSIAEVAAGVTRYLATNSRLKFTILNETHYVKLDSVNSTSKKATVTVSSTPQTFTLAENEIKKVDISEDSVYDLEVKVSNIILGGANVYVKKITESAPVVTPEAKKEEKKTAAEQVKEAVEKVAESKAVWIIVVIAIVAVIIIIFLVYKRKRYSKKGY